MPDEVTECRRSLLMRRLRENGADDFTKRELIELLLLFSVRQKDTHSADCAKNSD